MKVKHAGDFAHHEALWARSSRQAMEYWREAEASLQAALKIKPVSTELAYLLVHLLCCGGKVQKVNHILKTSRVQMHVQAQRALASSHIT